MASEARAAGALLAGSGPLVDAHAHFFHPRCGRDDWRVPNEARFRAGERMGITVHIASVLGSWGHTSPIYFPSPRDVTMGNDEMLAIQSAEPDRVRCYATVNPNETAHALEEIARCADRGAVGIKLAASRRADDPLLDPIAEAAARLGFPILHHIWQHRTREWPNQEISDGVDLGRLAARHPHTQFILAHIGGGGDYRHTFPAVEDLPNVHLDLSGSGVDRGMLDDALRAVGAARLIWGCDITMETGLAKLWALEVIGLSSEEMANIRWRNAARIFPEGSLPGIPATSAGVHSATEAESAAS
ncbi:MAG TPA: amidohydrolase family protein [Gemmatimonadaceae bacterium]|nr:amidohydrolase family protein [Gemmatimonadaceae bacterium]